MLFIADLVADLNDPRILSIETNDLKSAVHFAVYDGDEIRKLVFLNTEFFNKNGSRTSQEFDLSAILGRKLRLRRLTGEASEAKSGITWAGQDVDGDGRMLGTEQVERITDGIVKVFSSEAVIVERSAGGCRS